jgi:hypothetical protein
MAPIQQFSLASLDLPEHSRAKVTLLGTTVLHEGPLAWAVIRFSILFQVLVPSNPESV